MSKIKLTNLGNLEKIVSKKELKRVLEDLSNAEEEYGCYWVELDSGYVATFEEVDDLLFEFTGQAKKPLF
jgi:hypothetical protein